MKVLIDADACPVKDIAIKVAKVFELEVLIFCDTAHEIKREGIETITVSQGADAVDYEILKRIQKNDILISQDYGLASIALAKEAFAINQNGLIYNKFNIESLLFSRHMSKKARESGKRTTGPKKRLREDDLKFEENFIELIKRNLKK